MTARSILNASDQGQARFSARPFCAIPTTAMKPILTLLFCCVAALQCRAAECLPLKVGNPEGNYIVPGVRGEIVYQRVGNVSLALDAYVQKRGTKRPALLVIHGGNWDSGSRAAFIGQQLELLTRAGFNWFVVDYRLGGLGNYQTSLADLRAALSFVRCHAREFRIDADNIALFGEDTGAHLAALLAAERPAGVTAVALIGGQYDLHQIPSLKTQANSLLTEASPLSRISQPMPATLVVHGANDREAPPEQARQYCDRLRTSGAQCQYLSVEGAIHRAENWPPHQWAYKEELRGWLTAQMRLSQADHQPYVTRLRKDIVYDAERNLKLDAFTPPGAGPFPVVLIAHGGGWEAGDKVTYVTPLFATLAQAGFAWISLDYRLTPQVRNPEQLADVRNAVRYVQQHARELRIDPQRIALLGESASGQLVAQLAVDGSLKIAAVVPFYGVYNFELMARELTPRSIPTRLFGITKLDDEARATLRRFSPLHTLGKTALPMLLICGTKDGLFVQQQEFTAALEKAGIAFDQVTLSGAPHGMENWEGHPEWMSYKAQLVAWLRAKLANRA